MTESNDCVICLQPLDSEGAHAICFLPCGHVIGHSCGLKQLQQHKKCPFCNKQATAKQLKRLYLPSPLPVQQATEELKSENLNLKRKLQEMEVEVKRARIASQGDSYGSVQEEEQIKFPKTVPSLKLLAQEAGLLARFGEFDKFGSFYFCSMANPPCLKVFDGDFRVVAYSPAISASRNINCFYLDKDEPTINIWGLEGCVRIFMDARTEFFAGQYELGWGSLIQEICIEKTGMCAVNGRDLVRYKTPLPHSIVKFEDTSLTGRVTFLLISRDGAQLVKSTEWLPVSRFPTGSVSAAKVTRSTCSFVLAFRSCSDAWLEVRTLENGILTLIAKLVGHKNSYTLCRPACCQLNEKEYVAVMLDEGVGFCVWRFSRSVEPISPVLRWTSPVNISHMDIYEVAWNKWRIATLATTIVQIHELHLE